MAGKKHTHKYHKVDAAGTTVWACALPECTHYMPDHLKHLVPGKNSLCWNCGESFPLDDRAIKLDKPVCINCAFGVVDSLLDDTLAGGFKFNK
jgi:hypothetical protein